MDMRGVWRRYRYLLLYITTTDVVTAASPRTATTAMLTASPVNALLGLVAETYTLYAYYSIMGALTGFTVHTEKHSLQFKTETGHIRLKDELRLT